MVSLLLGAWGSSEPSYSFSAIRPKITQKKHPKIKKVVVYNDISSIAVVASIAITTAFLLIQQKKNETFVNDGGDSNKDD